MSSAHRPFKKPMIFTLTPSHIVGTPAPPFPYLSHGRQTSEEQISDSIGGAENGGRPTTMERYLWYIGGPPATKIAVFNSFRFRATYYYGQNNTPIGDLSFV